MFGLGLKTDYPYLYVFQLVTERTVLTEQNPRRDYVHIKRNQRLLATIFFSHITEARPSPDLTSIRSYWPYAPTLAYIGK